MKKETFTIDAERMDRLRNHCKKTGMKMSVCVRQGLDLFHIREIRMENLRKKDESKE